MLEDNENLLSKAYRKPKKLSLQDKKAHRIEELVKQNPDYKSRDIRNRTGYNSKFVKKIMNRIDKHGTNMIMKRGPK